MNALTIFGMHFIVTFNKGGGCVNICKKWSNFCHSTPDGLMGVSPAAVMVEKWTYTLNTWQQAGQAAVVFSAG